MIRPGTDYTTNFTADLIATYEYVKSGKAQIVDARHHDEFEAGTIPGAINIPYDDVLSNHTIKNETGLSDVFSNLSKDQPVVVFTDTGIKASVVWFSLELMGYNAKLYSWVDWLANRPPESDIANSSNTINVST